MTRTRIVPNVSATIDGHEWIVTGGGTSCGMRCRFRMHCFARCRQTTLLGGGSSVTSRATASARLPRSSPTQLAIRLDDRAFGRCAPAGALGLLAIRCGRAAVQRRQARCSCPATRDARRNARHSAVMRERWAAMTPEQRRAKQPSAAGARLGTRCRVGAADGRVPNADGSRPPSRHEQTRRQRKVDARKRKPNRAMQARSERWPRRSE